MSTADILRLNTLRPEVREHADSAKAHSQEAHNTAASALARSSVRHAEPEVEILVERLFFPTGVQSPRVVMVAEVERATNKDCVAGKIAEALARRVEQPVCAVEADFLFPSLAKYFEAGYGACLAEARYLMPQIPQFVVSARQGNLSVLTRASTAASIDPSSAIHSCLEGLSHESVYVVISGPPITESLICHRLAQLTNGIVLVLEANQTRRGLVTKTCSELKQSGVAVLGIVLTNRKFPIPARLYQKL